MNSRFALILALIASISWQTYAASDVFSGELFRSFGYGFASVIVSSLYWAVGIGFICAYLQIHKANFKHQRLRVAYVGVLAAPIFRMVLFPMSDQSVMPIDMVIGAIVLVLGFMASSAVKDLIGHEIDKRWEIDGEMITVGGRGKEFSFVRAGIAYALMTYVAFSTLDI